MEAAVSSKGRGRRKACDLCCQKKIRCNGAKPQCSQCQTYDSECMYNGAQRKRIPRARTMPRVESLEARLGRVESMLEGLTTQIHRLSQKEDGQSATEDVQKMPSSSGEREDGWTLPPLVTVLPIVEEYFLSTNRLLPLFDQTEFMKMLRGWYSSSARRDPAVWASINVVLALGLLLQPQMAARGSLMVATLVRNAQSVLDEISSREEDLLGAQTVLGLCILFQESPDPQAASVLTATAVTLVHRLRLYSRARHENLSQADARQRDRLFWIAYVLDKNISLRAQQPPLLADVRADISLPDDDPVDGAGVIYSRQGTNKINFLRLRVQLGIIQGKVYDRLCSVAADKLLPAAKEQFVCSIERMLNQWENSLPKEFMPESILESAPPETVQHLAALHWTYLQTLAMAHRAHLHIEQWVQNILRYGTIIIDQPIAYAVTSPQSSLPGSWSKLVSTSRACIKLLESMPAYEKPLIWSSTCGRITALLLLLMNNLTEPRHDMLIEDQRLVETLLQSLGHTAATSSDGQFEQIYQACQLLTLKARIVMERIINVSSASETECLMSTVKPDGCLNGTEIEFSTSQMTSEAELTPGSTLKLYHCQEYPEILPIDLLEKTASQEDTGPLSLEFSGLSAMYNICGNHPEQPWE